METTMTKLTVLNHMDVLKEIQSVNATISIDSAGCCDFSLSGETLFVVYLPPTSKYKLTTAMNRIVIINEDGHMVGVSTVSGLEVGANLSANIALDIARKLTEAEAISVIETDEVMNISDPIEFLIGSEVMFHVVGEGPSIIKLPGDIMCTVVEGIEVLCYNGEVLFDLHGATSISNVFTFTKKGIL